MLCNECTEYFMSVWKPNHIKFHFIFFLFWMWPVHFHRIDILTGTCRRMQWIKWKSCSIHHIHRIFDIWTMFIYTQCKASVVYQVGLMNWTLNWPKWVYLTFIAHEHEIWLLVLWLELLHLSLLILLNKIFATIHNKLDFNFDIAKVMKNILLHLNL